MRFDAEHFKALPVVGILRGFDAENTLAIVEAAARGGLRNVEITMNTPGAPEIIAEAVRRFGSRMNVGAGTVMTTDDLDRALAAGASFVVTPVVDAGVIGGCSRAGVPVFPGAFTPTEIWTAHSLGATAVKLFPADTLGPGYLRSVRGPLDRMKLLPVGGVGLEQFIEYMRAGAAGVGVGGPLFPAQLVRTMDWDGLARECSRWLEAWRSLLSRSPELAAATELEFKPRE